MKSFVLVIGIFLYLVFLSIPSTNSFGMVTMSISNSYSENLLLNNTRRSWKLLTVTTAHISDKKKILQFNWLNIDESYMQANKTLSPVNDRQISFYGLQNTDLEHSILLAIPI